MAERLHVQCPNCQQYFPDEACGSDEHGNYLLPEHDCFIGSRPVHMSEGQVVLSWTYVTWTHGPVADPLFYFPGMPKGDVEPF